MNIKLFTIPNLLTLSNLMCGTASIAVSLLSGDLRLAAALIVLAAVFDFFDGFAARMLKCPSAIGVQLDSLADMVSFGVAPAFAMFVLYGQSPSAFGLDDTILEVGRYMLLLSAAFAALRLAKFNIDESQHEEFAGLTTTADAIFCASLCYCCVSGGVSLAKEWIFAIVAVTSALMISPIRMFSFKMKSFGWRGNEVRYLFLAAAAVLLIWLRTYAIPLIIVIYVVVSTVLWAVRPRRSQ